MSRAVALGLAGELAFELAAAAPSYAEGKTGSEILGESIFGIFGAGTTFNEELAKYADPKAKEIIDLQEDIKQLEKEVIKSLEENVNVNWDVAENNPNLEFEMLIDHVKRLFKK